MFTPNERPLSCSACRRGPLALLALALCGVLGGCAALSNPVANGIPVRKLPPELLGESREGFERTPLSSLRQGPPKAYLLAPGDILGVWIEGILGERGTAPPLHIPEAGNLSPAIGFPVPVRDDGTISLPLVPSINVRGMTLDQAQEAIRDAYTVKRKILQPGRERILVSLQRPRQYHILVIRQDAGGGDTTGGTGGGATGLRATSRATGFIIGAGGGGQGSRHGTGFAIDLPAYENDLLNALARTGGFPGTDAVNEIVIERGSFAGAQGRNDKMNDLRKGPLAGTSRQSIRIPLRVRVGEPLPLRPEDVILQTGDIVYIEAREADVFYTAGLLPAGEYTLPRDTDLDVVEAITRIGGSIESGGLSTINITGTLLTPGFGFPSPSLVTIIRKTRGNGQLAIRVDLKRALRDPRERIRIQPKDVIILQEKPEEAIGRYFSQVFKFDLIYKAIDTSHAQGTANLSVP